jgi:hypothetical protein
VANGSPVRPGHERVELGGTVVGRGEESGAPGNSDGEARQGQAQDVRREMAKLTVSSIWRMGQWGRQIF